MSNPVIEQLKAFANFEENEIGEAPAESLHAYAAQAALKELIGNWEAAMVDGTPLRDMLTGDIDMVIRTLGEMKRTLVSGLGDKLDHAHVAGPSPR